MQFIFKIQLKNVIEPKVWRRVSVPANFSFARFHLVIQAAFGWGNYHLYQFSEKGYGSFPIISPPSEWDDGDTKDAKKIKLSQIFKELKQKYTYIYDFGDDWLHIITLEKILEEPALKAILIKGEGTCPPEDCGGPWGYAKLKEILSNPKDPEYAEWKEWLGLSKNQKWDTEAFDLEETGRMVGAA
jgi:hypothetical protein